jgi:hypothetical protein
MKLANTILLWGTLITALLMYPLGYAAFTHQNEWIDCILLPLATIIGPLSGFLAVLACIYGLISIVFPRRFKSGLLLPLLSIFIGAAVLLTVFIIPTWQTMKQRSAMEQSLELPCDEE